MNKFEKAIRNKELFEFIIGDGDYFIQDREYDGHNPLQSFKQYTEKYFQETGNYIFEDIFWDNIIKELLISKDYNLFLENLISFLLPYYSVVDTKILQMRVINTSQEFVTVLLETMRQNKQQLIEDNRGIGIEWNTSNKGLGIYGGVIYLLDLITKKSGLKFY